MNTKQKRRTSLYQKKQKLKKQIELSNYLYDLYCHIGPLDLLINHKNKMNAYTN